MQLPTWTGCEGIQTPGWLSGEMGIYCSNINTTSFFIGNFAGAAYVFDICWNTSYVFFFSFWTSSRLNWCTNQTWKWNQKLCLLSFLMIRREPWTIVNSYLTSLKARERKQVNSYILSYSFEPYCNKSY